MLSVRSAFRVMNIQERRCHGVMVGDCQSPLPVRPGMGRVIKASGERGIGCFAHEILHGSRMDLESIAFASSSPVNFSETGSNFSGRFNAAAMLPR